MEKRFKSFHIKFFSVLEIHLFLPFFLGVLFSVLFSVIILMLFLVLFLLYCLFFKILNNPCRSQFSLHLENVHGSESFSHQSIVIKDFFCVAGTHDTEWGIYSKTSQASQYCTSDWGDGHANRVVPCHGTCKGEYFGVKLLIKNFFNHIQKSHWY